LLDGISNEIVPDTTSTVELERVLLDLAGQDALTLAQRSYQATLLRSIETAIASHPRVMAMIRAPQVYLGRETEELREILHPLVGDVADGALGHIVSLIRSGVALRETKMSVDSWFSDLLRRDCGPDREFRCLVCGYHFQSIDLGRERRDICLDVGAILAHETEVGRLRDEWKSPKPDYRMATIDHILPEAALGPTYAPNLRIICKFCNHVRKLTRRYEELLSNRAASALLAVAGGSRGQWAYEAAVYFSINWRPYCEAESCNATVRDTELTAVPVSGNRRWTGLLPWQLETRCYTHSGLM